MLDEKINNQLMLLTFPFQQTHQTYYFEEDDNMIILCCPVPEPSNIGIIFSYSSSLLFLRPLIILPE